MSSYDTLIANGNDALAAHIKAVMPPIGSILPWAKTITGTPSLPAGYVECSGQVLSDADSPLNGDTIPNLNASGGGTQRLLRGSSTSGTTGGVDTTPDHSNHAIGTSTFNGGSDHVGCGGETAGGSHSQLPPYYQIVWVMRVK